MNRVFSWIVVAALLPTPCLAVPPDGTQSLSGTTRPARVPAPTSLGGPVKSNDATRNLARIGTGMHHR
jgi:hypothetical protein